jgi:hypothetical protein
MSNMRFIPLNDILELLSGKSTGFPSSFYEQVDPDFRPAPQTPQVDPGEPKWNGDKAFELANDIKARRAKIDEIKAAQKAELEREQKALEEAEKQYHDELSHIRYVGNDKELQLLIPREKMFQLVKGLTDVINGNKEAKSYKVKITL